MEPTPVLKTLHRGILWGANGIEFSEMTTSSRRYSNIP